MKYYLFLGYKTIEPTDQIGKIQVYLNDVMVEVFSADQFETKQVNKIMPLGWRTSNRSPKYNIQYDFKWQVNIAEELNIDTKINSEVPKKFKVIEIDDKDMKVGDQIKIKVEGGTSNYTNGFMTRRNLILIYPIFLVPEIIFKDETLIENIFQRNKKFFYWLPRYKNYRNVRLSSFPTYENADPDNEAFVIHSNQHVEVTRKVYQWPGPNIAKTPGTDNRYTAIYMANGGDWEIDFYVHKKHQVYSLQAFEEHPKGYVQLNMTFMLLYDQFKRLINALDSDK